VESGHFVLLYDDVNLVLLI